MLLDLLLLSCSEFASSIPKKFTVRYDPFTESVEILESKTQIYKTLQSVSQDLRTLTEALNKL